MPTVLELKREAKNLSVPGYTKMSKSELVSIINIYKSSNRVIHSKIDVMLRIISEEPFTLTEGAYGRISEFICKLASGVVIPRYLGEAALAHTGLGVMAGPYGDRIEYVILELLSLALNHARDRHSTTITIDDVVRVAINDPDFQIIF